MATVTGTRTDLGDRQSYRWTPLTETNADGSPAGFTGSGDRTFQVTGNFGAGGTVVLQGSLDESNWFTLNDGEGAEISMTAAGLRSVLESPPFVRPFVSAGTGVSVTAQLSVRR